jgi:hypothetical protein
MIEELARVVLARDLPEHGLRAGDLGTVVLVHGNAGYTVEFLTLAGDTVAVVTVPADAVRTARLDEIGHARALAASV